MPSSGTDSGRWEALVESARQGLQQLADDELAWLRRRCAAIGELQNGLDRLFAAADGSAACAACHGDCCGCGRHHLTLTNLFSLLLAGRQPPQPDFSETCPFLGEAGCLLPVAQRPFNCITFLCETVEGRLDTEQRTAFYTLEQALRREYEQVAERFPLASLRGIWIAAERMGPSSLPSLAPPGTKQSASGFGTADPPALKLCDDVRLPL